MAGIRAGRGQSNKSSTFVTKIINCHRKTPKWLSSFVHFVWDAYVQKRGDNKIIKSYSSYLLFGKASGLACISWIISSEDTKVSAFSFKPISDLIRGLPPGARSSRTARNT